MKHLKALNASKARVRELYFDYNADYLFWICVSPRQQCVRKINPLNCWKLLKTITLQRKDEICLIVNVAKAEKSDCMTYG